jgi:hypothetical protein
MSEDFINNRGNFTPMNQILIKEYTREQLLSFAQHCMTKLLTTYDETGGGEISAENLRRIDEVLKEYKKPKQR